MASKSKRLSPHQKSLANFVKTHLQIHDNFVRMNEVVFAKNCLGKIKATTGTSGRWIIESREVAASKVIIEQMKEPFENVGGTEIKLEFMKCASINERDENEDINDLSENIMVVCVKFSRNISFNKLTAWLGLKNVPSQEQLLERGVRFCPGVAREWFNFFVADTHGFKHVHATFGEHNPARESTSWRLKRSPMMMKLERSLRDLLAPPVFQFKWSAESMIAMRAQRLEAVKECQKAMIECAEDELNEERQKLNDNFKLETVSMKEFKTMKALKKQQDDEIFKTLQEAKKNQGHEVC